MTTQLHDAHVQVWNSTMDLAEQLFYALSKGGERCWDCPHNKCCEFRSENCPAYVFNVWAAIPYGSLLEKQWDDKLKNLEPVTVVEGEPCPVCSECGQLTPCSLCGTRWDTCCPICEGHATYDEFIAAELAEWEQSQFDWELDAKLRKK